MIKVALKGQYEKTDIVGVTQNKMYERENSMSPLYKILNHALCNPHDLFHIFIWLQLTGDDCWIRK